MLRAPWGQPRGSDRDSAEESAFHLLLLDPAGKAVACGRLPLMILTKPRSDIWPLRRMPALVATAAGFLRLGSRGASTKGPENRLKCARKRRAILPSARLRGDWCGDWSG